MPNERLVVTMEAKDQLSPALKQVGKAAGDTAKEVEKLTAADVSNFGRGMLRGATTLATGLYGLAKASSDLAEAQNFSNQIFTDAAPAINKYAKAAATSIGMSERAALDAAASVGIFGQRIELTGQDLAKFSTDLVTLASDMASIKNTKPEEAVTAIAAAMRNEYEPIRRYGVVLNDVVLKARALEQGTYDGTGQLTQQQKIIAVNAELYDQLGFAMGDFMRTQDELANQTRIAQAQFENLKANLGDALRPAFIQITSSANSMLETLNKVPEPIKAIGANLALVGTAALGLGGAFLFTVGKMGEMLNTARDLKAKLDNVATSGTRTQQAMLGIGKVAAGLGIAAVASQVVFDTLNQVNDVAGKTTTAVKELNVALAKGSKQEAWSAFLDIAKQKDDALTFGHLITDVGKKIQLVTSDTKRPIEDLDAAWKQLMDQDPTQAAEVLKIMEEQAGTLDKNSGQYKDNMMLVQRWGDQLKLTTQDLQAQGQEGQLSAEVLEKFGDSTITAAEKQKELQKAEEDATKAAEEYAEMMTELAKGVEEAERAFDTAAEKAEAFGEGLEAATGPSGLLKNVADLQGAFADLLDSFKDDDGNIDKTKMSMDAMTSSGRDNISAMEDLAGIMDERLLMVYEASGGSINAVTEAQKGMVTEFDNMLRAAGASEEQIQAFNDVLGETPESIQVAIRIRDDEVALQKLDMLNIKMDEIPPEISTAIMAEMDEGDFVSAYQLAKNFIAGQPLTYGTRVDDPTTVMVEGIDKAQTTADGNPVDIPTTVEEPTNKQSIFDGLGGWFKNNRPSTEVDVKAGDVQTPQGKNIAYAKSNPPKTEIETDPGDYQGPWRTIDSYMKSHDPETTVKTLPGPYFVTWFAIALFFASRPVELTVETQQGNISATWQSISSYFRSHPVSVDVKPDPTNLGTAWSEIQNYFNGRPVTIKVNSVAGTLSVPRIPGATGAAAPSAAEAQAGAMASMGLTAVGDTLLAAPTRVRAGVAAPSGTPSIINLNVTMPSGTNEAKVIDLLKRFQRSNGSRILPRG